MKININGKEYELSPMKEGHKALWKLKVEEELRSKYHPMRAFMSQIEGLPQHIQDSAVSAFVETRQYLEYPDWIRLEAENSLTSARLLCEMLTDCDPNELTDDNKSDFLSMINLFMTDKEMFKILEIRRRRNASSSVESGQQSSTESGSEVSS